MIHATFVIAGNTPGAPPPSTYVAAAKRFADTYVRFPADMQHRLILLDSHGGYTPEIAGFFSDIPHTALPYAGLGWDIGAHLHAAYTLPADDWIMCFSSWGHFRQRGWLAAFARARDRYWDGLYGSTASFERSPHVRGTGFMVRCGQLQAYPHRVNSRKESLDFEAGPESLTNWFLRRRDGVWIVTPRKTVPLAAARHLEHGFRREQQTDIWTFDKHTDVFERGTEEERTIFNGWSYPPPPSRWRRLKTWARQFLPPANG